MTTTSRVSPWTVMMRWRVLNGLRVRRTSSRVAANLRVVLRVFVREHKLGRGGDSSVFIAVEPLDLF
jgi:hypothetical protein